MSDFPGGNDEAKFVSAGNDHSIHQVFADRARTLDRSINSSSNRKQFF
jgi:hypothetical protein